jgi:hypothetical protein
MSRILKWIQAHHTRARTQPNNSAEGAKTSHEDQEFCYQPLETEDTIRLVFVYPGTEDTEVSCDIHHIALSQGSSYIALSYVSRNPAKKKGGAYPSTDDDPLSLKNCWLFFRMCEPTTLSSVH